MDWEHKFSNIVKDTESNLAKVKHKLETSRMSNSSTFNYYGNDEFYSDKPSYIDDRLASSTNSTLPSKYTPYSTINHYQSPLPLAYNNSLSKSASHQNLYSPKASGLAGYTATSGIDTSIGVAGILQDRIDMQTKAIEGLMQTIHRLEEERDAYYKQVGQFRDEMTALNNRITEKGVDIGTERKMESWKREVMSELQSLRNQVEFYRSKDNESGVIEASQISSLLKEIHQLRKYMQEECETVRRGVDSLKGRLMHLEIEVQGLAPDNRELTRRHDRLAKAVQDIEDRQQRSAREFERDAGHEKKDKIQIDELRNSYRYMTDKLSSIEDQIQKYRKPPMQSSTTHQPQHDPTDLFSTSISDLGSETDIDLYTKPTYSLTTAKTEDLLTTFNTDHLDTDHPLETLDSVDLNTLDSIDLGLSTADDLSVTDGDGLSLDEL